MFTTKDWVLEHRETVRKIEQAYATDRYVDIDGAVWVGRGEAPNEVWIVESGSDEGYMTKAEMMKKMVNELSGDEQYRRDEAVRIEALYEYAVKLTSISTGASLPLYDEDDWHNKAGAERELERNRAENEERRARGAKLFYSFSLVRRRKAGPVEEVDS